MSETNSNNSTLIREEISAIQRSIEELNQKFNAVEDIYSLLVTPQNEETTLLDILKDFQKCRSEIQQKHDEIQSFLTTQEENIQKINDFIITCEKTIEECNEKSNTIAKKEDEITEIFSNLQSEFRNYQEKSKESIEQFEKQTEEKFTSYDQKINNLITESSNANNSTRDEFNESATQIQTDFNNYINQKKKEIEQQQIDTQKSYQELYEKIESLLPSATSAGLAKAFHDRTEELKGSQKSWIKVLVIAAFLIVIFGGIAFFTGSNITNLPDRLTILAGLVFIEEFARRNYNICTRLAENYAYKKAVALSYIGFKKELETIKLPTTDNKETVDATAVLAKIFLDYLEKEPRENIFDKEKQMWSPNELLALQEKITPNTADVPKVLEQAATGKFLSRITWPAVAVFFILAITACVLVYLLK